MQQGGFQSQPLMRLTLVLTMVFMTAFWVSNFALYLAKMDFTTQSVRNYYLGSEELFKMPRTYQSMLEVSHSHLPMIAMVVLLLTHLLIFTPYSFRVKVFIIVSGFLFALLNEGSGWLVRFVRPEFAILKIVSFLSFQAVIGFLIFEVARFTRGRNGNTKPVFTNDAPHITKREMKLSQVKS